MGGGSEHGAVYQSLGASRLMNKPREREMTKRDWEALYLVMQLSEQIVLYGESALHNFVAAMRASGKENA